MEITLTENGFLQLTATVKVPQKEITAERGADKKTAPEEVTFSRVFLHRAFPFDNPDEFIAVSGKFPKKEEDKSDKNSDADTKKCDKDVKTEEKENTTSFGELKEIGIIKNISDLNEDEQEYIRRELGRKYFMPVIQTIQSVKEKYGYAYFDTVTDAGRQKFTLHDTHRNIIKATDDRLILNDVNGNRYEIASLATLDAASLRKIELYL